MTCDLHLDEHTAQMYVFIDIISSDHVIVINEHIKLHNKLNDQKKTSIFISTWDIDILQSYAICSE